MKKAKAVPIMLDNKIDFVCPICNSKEYLKKWKSNEIFGPGGRSWITGYVCAGCSVRFDDPEKFTKKAKPRFARKRETDFNIHTLPYLVSNAHNRCNLILPNRNFRRGSCFSYADRFNCKIKS
jgi:hypothetical protein